MTLYEVLDVSSDCTGPEIEEAHRAKRSASPETGPFGWLVRALHLTADVDYAYSVLSNGLWRQDYDRCPDGFPEFHPVPIVI